MNLIAEVRPNQNSAADADKRLLAFDALSKLTEQFALKQDVELLIETLLLTITGQFAVGSAYVAVNNPSATGGTPRFSAVGKFRDNPLLASSSGLLNRAKVPFRHPVPCCIGDLHTACTSPRLISSLREAGVELVAPLCHGKSIIGVIGLGEKLNHRPFEDSEIEFLGTFVNSISPLINNSLLFLNIKSLNEWHVNLINTITHGIFVFDARRMLTKVNTAAIEILADLTDRNKDESALQGLLLDQVFPRTVFSGWAKRFHEISGAGDAKVFEKLVAQTSAGERIFNVRVTVVPQEGRHDSDLIITLDDVTAQTESESRLFEVEKFAEKGMMAASIAHELNNFLAMILAGAQISQLALLDGNTEKVTSSLSKLEENVDRMARFTADLMDIARLDTQKALRDLNSIISDVLSFVSVQKKFTRISIKTDLDPALPPIEADEDQMSQLFLNLLNNAADAIGEAGRDRGLILIRTSVQDAKVCFSISDNGMGIDPAVQEQLFNSRLTTKKTGHGFGLVTCAKIIENHQGEVEIESTPSVGANFIIRFPVSMCSGSAKIGQVGALC